MSKYVYLKFNEDNKKIIEKLNKELEELKNKNIEDNTGFDEFEDVLDNFDETEENPKTIEEDKEIINKIEGADNVYKIDLSEFKDQEELRTKLNSLVEKSNGTINLKESINYKIELSLNDKELDENEIKRKLENIYHDKIEEFSLIGFEKIDLKIEENKYILNLSSNINPFEEENIEKLDNNNINKIISIIGNKYNSKIISEYRNNKIEEYKLQTKRKKINNDFLTFNGELDFDNLDFISSQNVSIIDNIYSKVNQNYIKNLDIDVPTIKDKDSEELEKKYGNYIYNEKSQILKSLKLKYIELTRKTKEKEKEIFKLQQEIAEIRQEGEEQKDHTPETLNKLIEKEKKLESLNQEYLKNKDKDYGDILFLEKTLNKIYIELEESVKKLRMEATAYSITDSLIENIKITPNIKELDSSVKLIVNTHLKYLDDLIFNSNDDINSNKVKINESITTLKKELQTKIPYIDIKNTNYTKNIDSIINNSLKEYFKLNEIKDTNNNELIINELLKIKSSKNQEYISQKKNIVNSNIKEINRFIKEAQLNFYNDFPKEVLKQGIIEEKLGFLLTQIEMLLKDNNVKTKNDIKELKNIRRNLEIDIEKLEKKVSDNMNYKYLSSISNIENKYRKQLFKYTEIIKQLNNNFEKSKKAIENGNFLKSANIKLSNEFLKGLKESLNKDFYTFMLSQDPEILNNDTKLEYLVSTHISEFFKINNEKYKQIIIDDLDMYNDLFRKNADKLGIVYDTDEFGSVKIPNISIIKDMIADTILNNYSLNISNFNFVITDIVSDLMSKNKKLIKREIEKKEIENKNYIKEEVKNLESMKNLETLNETFNKLNLLENTNDVKEDLLKYIISNIKNNNNLKDSEINKSYIKKNMETYAVEKIKILKMRELESGSEDEKEKLNNAIEILKDNLIEPSNNNQSQNFYNIENELNRLLSTYKSKSLLNNNKRLNGIVYNKDKKVKPEFENLGIDKDFINIFSNIFDDIFFNDIGENKLDIERNKWLVLGDIKSKWQDQSQMQRKDFENLNNDLKKNIEIYKNEQNLIYTTKILKEKILKEKYNISKEKLNDYNKNIEIIFSFSNNNDYFKNIKSNIQALDSNGNIKELSKKEKEILEDKVSLKIEEEFNKIDIENLSTKEINKEIDDLVLKLKNSKQITFQENTLKSYLKKSAFSLKHKLLDESIIVNYKIIEDDSKESKNLLKIEEEKNKKNKEIIDFVVSEYNSKTNLNNIVLKVKKNYNISQYALYNIILKNITYIKDKSVLNKVYIDIYKDLTGNKMSIENKNKLYKNPYFKKVFDYENTINEKYKDNFNNYYYISNKLNNSNDMFTFMNKELNNKKLKEAIEKNIKVSINRGKGITKDIKEFINFIDLKDKSLEISEQKNNYNKLSIINNIDKKKLEVYIIEYSKKIKNSDNFKNKVNTILNKFNFISLLNSENKEEFEQKIKLILQSNKYNSKKNKEEIKKIFNTGMSSYFETLGFKNIDKDFNVLKMTNKEDNKVLEKYLAKLKEEEENTKNINIVKTDFINDKKRSILLKEQNKVINNIIKREIIKSIDYSKLSAEEYNNIEKEISNKSQNISSLLILEKESNLNNININKNIFLKIKNKVINIDINVLEVYKNLEDSLSNKESNEEIEILKDEIKVDIKIMKSIEDYHTNIDKNYEENNKFNLSKLYKNKKLDISNDKVIGFIKNIVLSKEKYFIEKLYKYINNLNKLEEFKKEIENDKTLLNIFFPYEKMEKNANHLQKLYTDKNAKQNILDKIYKSKFNNINDLEIKFKEIIADGDDEIYEIFKESTQSNNRDLLNIYLEKIKNYTDVNIIVKNETISNLKNELNKPKFNINVIFKNLQDLGFIITKDMAKPNAINFKEFKDIINNYKESEKFTFIYDLQHKIGLKQKDKFYKSESVNLYNPKSIKFFNIDGTIDNIYNEKRTIDKKLLAETKSNLFNSNKIDNLIKSIYLDENNKMQEIDDFLENQIENYYTKDKDTGVITQDPHSFNNLESHIEKSFKNINVLKRKEEELENEEIELVIYDNNLGKSTTKSFQIKDLLQLDSADNNNFIVKNMSELTEYEELEEKIRLELEKKGVSEENWSREFDILFNKKIEEEINFKNFDKIKDNFNTMFKVKKTIIVNGKEENLSSLFIKYKSKLLKVKEKRIKEEKLLKKLEKTQENFYTPINKFKEIYKNMSSNEKYKEIMIIELMNLLDDKHMREEWNKINNMVSTKEVIKSKKDLFFKKYNEEYLLSKVDITDENILKRLNSFNTKINRHKNIKELMDKIEEKVKNKPQEAIDYMKSTLGNIWQSGSSIDTSNYM